MKPEQQKWLLLLLLTLIWGSSFILIKKSLVSFNPYQVGALRVLISGIMLLPLALIHLKKFPKKQFKWLVLAAFGVGNAQCPPRRLTSVRRAERCVRELHLGHRAILSQIVAQRCGLADHYQREV